MGTRAGGVVVADRAGEPGSKSRLGAGMAAAECTGEGVSDQAFQEWQGYQVENRDGVAGWPCDPSNHICSALDTCEVGILMEQ